MQSLTEAPRTNLTAAQVTTLLTGNRLEVSAGLELLNTSNAVTSDISTYLEGGQVDRDCYAAVHGSCRLRLQDALDWGKARVRPYMTLSNAGVTARFNLGVYVLTTPDEVRRDVPTTYEVQGYDLLYLLQNPVGDTYVVTSGTTYLAAVQAVVTASGIGATVQLDGSAGATTVPTTMVWALPEPVSYLDIINDLLAAIGYIEVYADHNGILRSRPFQAVATAASEWTLNTSDATTNIVHEERMYTEDAWGAPNWWRFVRDNVAVKPIEGTGMYTVQNLDDGPSSQNVLGRVVRRPVQFLEVADHAALVAAGDRIVAEDRQVMRTVRLTVDPLPHMGHRDVFTLIDAAPSEKLVATAWTLNLDGTQGVLVLGGARATTDAKDERQAKATVTQASPLRIVVDGATVDSPALALNNDTYVLNDRVTATIRNPERPLVEGKEA